MFDCGGNGECARIHLAITSHLCVVSDKKSQRDGQMRQAKIKILNKTKHKVIFFFWINVTNFSLSLSLSLSLSVIIGIIVAAALGKNLGPILPNWSIDERLFCHT